MEKYNKQRYRNIQTIFEEGTGTNIATKGCQSLYGAKRMVAVMSMMMGFLVLSAFAYSKFSSINGDDVAFNPSYKGNGIFEITITNFSDKSLKLQEQVKVMRWSTAEEVVGENDKIVFENVKIEAHSEGTIVIDLSKGYDIAELEKTLPTGDWYYLVLTNNNFAFGQDWMCGIDFDENKSSTIINRPVKEEKKKEIIYSSKLRFEEWIWPTVSETVSLPYGEQVNGTFKDHINIAGNMGDAVYSVTEGVVVETGFDASYGNYILIEVDERITVRYGHLQEVLVDSGELITGGEKIGQMGKTGMATGPNLAFAVYEKGEAINPLIE